jgi:hypothetical protein
MWRFLLAGLLLVSALLALAVLDDLFSWSNRVTPLPPASTPAPIAAAPLPPPVAVVPVPTPMPAIPVPVVPQPMTASPVPALPAPALPALPTVTPLVPSPRNPSRPSAPDMSASILGDMVTARQLVYDGRIAEARQLLAKVQVAMVLRPVTPDQPSRDDTNLAASRIGTAMHLLDHNDRQQAIQTINQVLSSGF